MAAHSYSVAVRPPRWESPQLAADYERLLRSLLWRVRPELLQQGIDLLLARAWRRAAEVGQRAALAEVYERARRHTISRLVLRRLSRHESAVAAERFRGRMAELLDASIPAAPIGDAADFHCDCGLGGLARWLRAAGYDARFWPHLDDDELLRLTLGGPAILLTTDRRLMERGAIADGLVPALLAPLQAGKLGQFEFVLQRFGLPRKAPRCMACGGRLAPRDKEAVRDQIPPRTYAWLHEYFACQRCGQLFWRGAHWQHVERRLQAAAPARADGRRAACPVC